MRSAVYMRVCGGALTADVLPHRDQFCSLVFTLSNLYFFSCSYIVGFDRDPWRRCAIPHGWGIQFALASLPLLARLVQSVRRWVDSRLVTHLINVRPPPGVVCVR